MRIQTATAMVAMFLLAGVWSRDAAAEDARFGGGSFDGWDLYAMTESGSLSTNQSGGEAIVSLSSGTNQTFNFRDTPTLAALTIEAEDPAGAITNDGTIRVTVPTAWACRFDTDASATFSGDAAVKVGAASYTDGGRTVSIPVTSTFESNDTLIVSGLQLEELRLVSPDTKSLELDYDGDGVRDSYDLYTLQVCALWPGGSYDGWDCNAMMASASLDPVPGGTIIMFR